MLCSCQWGMTEKVTARDASGSNDSIPSRRISNTNLRAFCQRTSPNPRRPPRYKRWPPPCPILSHSSISPTQPYRSMPPCPRANPDAPERMAAFVVCHDGPVRCVDLGDTRDFAPSVADWNEEIMTDADDTSGVKLGLGRLGSREFMPSGTDRNGVHRARRSPGAVAWSALPAATGNSVLLERFAIATVPHGPFLLDQLRKPPSEPDMHAPVLAVGDVEDGTRAGDVLTARQGLSELRRAKTSRVVAVNSRPSSRPCPIGM